MESPPLWTPNPETLSSLRLDALRRKVNEKFGTKLVTYADLHKWSVAEPSAFWNEVWDLAEIIHSEPFTSVIDESIRIDSIPKWFVGTKLNYAENLLEKGQHDDIAIFYKGEGHPEPTKLTYGELRTEVAVWAAALRNAGVGKDDVVCGILPNAPETLIALLATSALGATWTSTSPDYGVTGIVERFKQTEPKILISVNAVFYNGKVHSMSKKLHQLVSDLPSLEKIVVIPFIQGQEAGAIDIPKSKWTWASEFLNNFRSLKTRLVYEQVPFNHPLFIMYSSGTTGKPKCMVHSVGGTLMKHAEEHLLQSNLKKTDVIFYYTTVGWMMYQWLISSLITGCTVILYDGAPSKALWSLIDEFKITIFGTSAKWLAVQEEVARKCIKLDGEDVEALKKELNKNKTSLKMILSTGSPLKPQSFDFIYEYVKHDVLVGSISGGTDCIGCFMGQNPMLPVYRGEIQSYHLGCDLDCVDDEGESVIGERGELVVRTPFPSMPTKFHNDTDGLLYKKAYFAKHTGIWAHGDFIMINPQTKGIVMLGRSDATLNPNGVRFGSAEIYQIVEHFIEVSDSVCVAQRNEAGTDERVVLFLRLLPNIAFSDDLVNRIKLVIREQLSPRHVPAVILPISDIPYTISGKKVEIAVRNIIEGEEVKNVGALANPKCLDLYRNIPVLQTYS
ncbi:acetoacetyl-CoA synthetase isoform X2 [Folsomia candida]|uniref:acetoacetyl-CoA synthetase isoform X2 n=1 Tax=Folsomia candida TaxID=158441 RepID=UPI000B8F2778|nr:acetoacetyl-CoA synthetase isoform X2 [Folsomia candida]